jgi:uncharacterized repeat protein (TIGR01451 family)
VIHSQRRAGRDRRAAAIAAAFLCGAAVPLIVSGSVAAAPDHGGEPARRAPIAPTSKTADSATADLTAAELTAADLTAPAPNGRASNGTPPNAPGPNAPAPNAPTVEVLPGSNAPVEQAPAVTPASAPTANRPAGRGRTRNSARRPLTGTETARRRPAAQGKISLSGTAPGGRAVPGGKYRWRYDLSNHGRRTARNVVVTVVLPKGFRVVSTTRRCVWQGGRTVRCRYGSLLPGGKVRGGFTARVERAAAPGVPMRPRAEVTWSRPAVRHAVTFPGVTVARTADLSVTGSAPRRVRPRQRVTYRFTVANRGTTPARGVTLTLGGDRRVRAASAGTGVTCRAAGRQAVCALGDLMGGDTRVVTFVARMPRGPRAGVAARAVVGSTTGDARTADNVARVTSVVAGTAIPVRTKATGAAPGAVEGRTVTRPRAGAKPRAEPRAEPRAGAAAVGVTGPKAAVRPAGAAKPRVAVKTRPHAVPRRGTTSRGMGQLAYSRRNSYPHGAQGWRPVRPDEPGQGRHREAADLRGSGTAAGEASTGKPAGTPAELPAGVHRVAAHTWVAGGQGDRAAAGAAPRAPAEAAPRVPAAGRPPAPGAGRPQAPGAVRAEDAAALSTPGWGTATAVVAMGALMGAGVAFAFLSRRSRRQGRGSTC